jgi:TRAP-type transport system small permease protein
MKILENAGEYCNRLAKVLTQVCVAIMAVVVALQVFFRYFLQNPIIWAEEAARYALVWMTFIGASIGIRAGILACMDLVATSLPPRARRWITTSVIVLNCLLIGFLFYLSIQLVGIPSVKNQASPAMRVPMSLVYCAMPVGLALMMFQSVLQLLQNLAGKGMKDS